MNRNASAVCAAVLVGFIALPALAEQGQAAGRDPSFRHQIEVEGYVPPVRTRQDVPHYSEQMRRAGIEGQVVLTGRVDAEGQVSKMKVRKGHPLLARAARKAIEKWEFEPAQSSRGAIAVNIEVKVNFVLRADRKAGDNPVSKSTMAGVTFSLPKDSSGS